jgi:hypothetical protein
MSLLSSLGKTFSSITSNPIGKALLIGATVYAGGSALGMWDSDLASIGGSFGSDAAASGMDAAPAAVEAAQGATESSVADQFAGANVAGVDATPFDVLQGKDATPLMDTDTGAMDSGVGLQDVRDRVVNGPGSFTDHAAQQLGLSQGNPGEMDQFMGGLKGEIRNPINTAGQHYMPPDVSGKLGPKSNGFLDFFSSPLAKAALITQAGGAIRGAFEPTPEDIAKAKYEAQLAYDRATRSDRAQNYNVAGVNMGMKPPLIG